MDKCQRCKAKTPSLQCMNCEIFRNLCNRCDNIIHNLPIKHKHTRIPIDVDSNERASLFNDNSSSNIINQEARITNEDNQEQNEPSSTSIKLPVQPLSLTQNNSILNSKFFYSNNYSKEYLNEVKDVFKREKGELEFKNKILQNNLSKLKVSFSEQIENYTKELEEIQKNNNIAINALKDNYEKKIEQLQTEHQIEIDSLKNNITHLEEKETEQSDIFTKQQEEKDKVIEQLNQRVCELEKELMDKDDEIFKLQNNLDMMISQDEKMMKDQREKLQSEYESKIGSIVENVEMTKNNLLKLVDDREIDIRNLMESHKTEIERLNETIRKLKEELECHKLNLIKIRDERNYFNEQFSLMKKNENSYICDNQMQMNEIQQLYEENKKLCEENDELKIQLSKYDNLIYGKIRPNFNY